MDTESPDPFDLFELIRRFLALEAAARQGWTKPSGEWNYAAISREIGVTAATIAQFDKGVRRGAKERPEKPFSPSGQLLRGLAKIAGVERPSQLLFKLETLYLQAHGQPQPPPASALAPRGSGRRPARRAPR